MSSSSVTRITTGSFRRRQSCPAIWIRRRSFRRSQTRTTRWSLWPTLARTAPISCIASSSRTSRGSGSSWPGGRTRRSHRPDHHHLARIEVCGTLALGGALALAPDRDAPHLSERDDFFYSDDPDGPAMPGRGACPPHQLARRAQPYPPQQSLSMTDAHQLIRRGRVFGPPSIRSRRASSRVVDARQTLPRDAGRWPARACISSASTPV